MKIDVFLDPAYNTLIERFVKFICKEYCILPRKIFITEYNLEESSGMCIDENDGEYIILVNKNRDLASVFTTVAHEMIHVKQYMTQDLGELLDTNKDVSYKDRWWEKEAYKNAVPLVEKFSKTI
jgi:hypothetical protein